MRALIVSNMRPSADVPHRGSFVRDQANALRALGVDVELLEFSPGASNLAEGVRQIRRAIRSSGFDVVHAHFGISGACARLAGARPLITTFHGTDVRHPLTGWLSRRLRRGLDLLAVASPALLGAEDGRPGLGRMAGRTAVLPCGADFERFKPTPRDEARRVLGLDPAKPCLFFGADPARRVKRHDRALAVAKAAGATLLTAGGISPSEMVTRINASDAVLITSDNEGFGLSAVEAMACETPVLARRLGAIPAIAEGGEGCLVGEFDEAAWAEHVRSLARGPRPSGLRERARWLSADAMAKRVVIAYGEVLGRQDPS